MNNTAAVVQRKSILDTCPSIDSGEESVVLILDQKFGSQQPITTFRNQTKLHMDWYNKMVSFYSPRSPALIIPPEYCVGPSALVIPSEYCVPAEFVDNIKPYSAVSTPGIFYFQQGDNLGSALSIEYNFVRFKEGFSSRSRFHHEVQKKNKSDTTGVKQVPPQNGGENSQPQLPQNEELVLEAIKNNPSAFMKAPLILRRDEDFVRKALEIDGSVFIYLQEWRSREDFFELSLKTSGKGFIHVDHRLRSEASARKAVSQYWQAIKVDNPRVEYYTELVELVLKNFTDKDVTNSDLISDKNIILKLTLHIRPSL